MLRCLQQCQNDAFLNFWRMSTVFFTVVACAVFSNTLLSFSLIIATISLNFSSLETLVSESHVCCFDLPTIRTRSLISPPLVLTL